jgi:hypothetical protein
MSTSSLNQSSTQVSNPALYQTILDLINKVDTLQKLINSYGLSIDSSGNLVSSNPILLSTRGIWVPNDSSGAGLAITTVTNGSPIWLKMDDIVIFSASIKYPTTTNAAFAQIGGLPFPCIVGTNFACSIGFNNTTLALTMVVSQGTNSMIPFTVGSGSSVTNAQLSGFILNISGTYRYK